MQSITAYRDGYTESVIDFDSLAVMDFDGVVIYDNDQTTQELQLVFDGDRINAVAGAYYLDADRRQHFDIVLGQIAAVPLTAYTGGVVDTKAWSLFADVSFDFTDKLALSLGGRYTERQGSADVFRPKFIGVCSPFFGNNSAVLFRTDCDYENDRTFDDFTPRVSVTYNLTRDADPYVGYCRGLQVGRLRHARGDILRRPRWKTVSIPRPSTRTRSA